MKIYLIIFLLIILFSPSFFAQEKEDTSKSKNLQPNPLTSLQNKIDDFDLYVELHASYKELPLDDNPKSIKLWTSALFNNTNSASVSSFPFDEMLEPLHRQYIQNSKFDPVRYFLGMAQTAAVGYLAYKSIKRYGFWK